MKNVMRHWYLAAPLGAMLFAGCESKKPVLPAPAGYAPKMDDPASFGPVLMPGVNATPETPAPGAPATGTAAPGTPAPGTPAPATK